MNENRFVLFQRLLNEIMNQIKVHQQVLFWGIFCFEYQVIQLLLKITAVPSFIPDPQTLQVAFEVLVQEKQHGLCYYFSSVGIEVKMDMIQPKLQGAPDEHEMLHAELDCIQLFLSE